jgi:hypothetical protein
VLDEAPRLRAPFPWFGGKSRAAPLIWRALGRVDAYCEPFAGSLAVLLGNPDPPAVEVVNDLDCMVANFWRAVRADPAAVASHADWPVNEADLHARHRRLASWIPTVTQGCLADPDWHDARVAGWWVWGLSAWLGSGWCAQGTEWQQKPYLGAGKRSGRSLQCHGQKPMLGHGFGVGVHATLARGKKPAVGKGIVGVHATLARGQEAEAEPEQGGIHGPRRAQGGCLDLASWFGDLAARLRHVRVLCGGWARVLTDSVVGEHRGSVGLVLDPPYDLDMREGGLYRSDAAGVSEEVLQWAASNAHRPHLRVALCAYDDGRGMPPGWTGVRWRAGGGYGNAGSGRARENRHREVVWFSPSVGREAAAGAARDLGLDLVA